MTFKRRIRKGKATTSKDDLEDRLINVLQKSTKTKEPPPSCATKYSTIAANCSQVAMLAIVIWGYFYTVLPVFQKEKLTEDLARLEIERSSWQEKLDSYARDIEESKINLSKLATESKGLEDRLNSIKYEKEQAEKALEILANKEQTSREQLADTAKALREAENQLYEQQRLTLLGKTPIPIESIFLINKSRDTFNIFGRDAQQAVAEKLHDTFVQPITFVDKKLEELTTQANSASSKIYRNVQLRLIEEYRKGIQSSAPMLQCPEPNFESWQAEFSRALALGDSMVDGCVDYHFKAREKKEGWSSREVAELKNSDFWEKQRKIFAHSCSITIDYKVSELYRERWTHISDPCEERLHKMSSIALEDGAALNLTPFRDTAPPTESHIKAQIQATIDGWYKSPDQRM
ncbi:hypothetical protein ACET8J_03915 [Aeromonas veronii]|uniref:hypothetical protein n=1 Tax=Aeromonas sp. 95A TaxID=3452729 RepID=UPI0038E78FED